MKLMSYEQWKREELKCLFVKREIYEKVSEILTLLIFDSVEVAVSQDLMDYFRLDSFEPKCLEKQNNFIIKSVNEYGVSVFVDNSLDDLDYYIKIN